MDKRSYCAWRGTPARGIYSVACMRWGHHMGVPTGNCPNCGRTIQKIPDTPWTQLDELIKTYVNGYEVYDCEDANGNTGDYTPTEFERCMIMDAIQGLINDDEIVDKLIEAREFTRSDRRANGECEICGHVLPAHWDACSAVSASGDSNGKP